MSLGFARDSFLDLAKLAHRHNNDDDDDGITSEMGGIYNDDEGDGDFGMAFDDDDDDVNELEEVVPPKADAVNAVASVAADESPVPTTLSFPSPSPATDALVRQANASPSSPISTRTLGWGVPSKRGLGAGATNTNEARTTTTKPNAYSESDPSTVYAGFASDYAEYAGYYSDPYATSYGGDGQGGYYSSFTEGAGGEGFVDNLSKRSDGKNGRDVFRCCLFAPWSAGMGDGTFYHDNDDDDDSSCGADLLSEATSSSSASAIAASESAAEGNRKMERAARQASPIVGMLTKEELDSGATTCEGGTETDNVRKRSLSKNEKGEMTGKKEEEANPSMEFEGDDEEGEEKKEEEMKRRPPKGILKKSRSLMRGTSLTDAVRRDDASVTSANNRRHLFPTYAMEAAKAANPNAGKKRNVKLSFAPMARVITITSQKEITHAQKSQTWWQRSDYDDFKKTGRIIARAMLEGGSEIWLKGRDSWNNDKVGTEDGPSQRASSETGVEENEQETEYERALHKYSGGAGFSSSSSYRANSNHNRQEAAEESQESENFGNKWWCKFGHSRRGLEHIASMEEGLQRQKNVNTATRAVMEEQRRQRMNRVKDPQKLANIAHQYTSWARDLALAAGAADAEAVRVNFKSGANDRTHYLVRGVGSSGATTASQFTDSKRYTFISGHIAAELLDANTSSAIQAKKRREEEEEEEERKKREADGDDESMAKKAAGYAANDGEKMDMSAVLSGMGSVKVRG